MPILVFCMKWAVFTSPTCTITVVQCIQAREKVFDFGFKYGKVKISTYILWTQKVLMMMYMDTATKYKFRILFSCLVALYVEAKN